MLHSIYSVIVKLAIPQLSGFQMFFMTPNAARTLKRKQRNMFLRSRPSKHPKLVGCAHSYFKQKILDAFWSGRINLYLGNSSRKVVLPIFQRVALCWAQLWVLCMLKSFNETDVNIIPLWSTYRSKIFSQSTHWPVEGLGFDSDSLPSSLPSSRHFSSFFPSFLHSWMYILIVQFTGIHWYFCSRHWWPPPACLLSAHLCSHLAPSPGFRNHSSHSISFFLLFSFSSFPHIWRIMCHSWSGSVCSPSHPLMPLTSRLFGRAHIPPHFTLLFVCCPSWRLNTMYPWNFNLLFLDG